MEPEKVPPLIRSARLICDGWSAMHVDNMTGAIVHDAKVDRALRARGINPLDIGEQDEIDGKLDAPIVIKRSHGGPKINPVMLDGFTASMIVQVWDKLSAENRAKFPKLVERFTVVGTIDRLWKIVRKAI